MVMSKAAALELARDELIPQIGTQRTTLSRFDAWLRGDNPVAHRAHQDPNAATNQLASLARTPMLRQIVEQLAQQLVLGSVASPSDPAASSRLWGPWDINGCPSQQGALYEAMIGYGAAYALVLPGESPHDAARPLSVRQDRALIRLISPRDLLVVERYSHVMHIVSGVHGRLRPGLNQFDVLAACFPAGTVSGAPKIRAMEIIDELEVARRGPYAGAVGYFGFSGNMDFCITIRTFLLKGDDLWVQAGAGIVADSVPEKEYEETINKSMGLRRAVELAEKGF